MGVPVISGEGAFDEQPDIKKSEQTRMDIKV